MLSLLTVSADVSITDDSVVETSETFSFFVTLPQPLAVSDSSINMAIVEILDDDSKLHRIL